MTSDDWGSGGRVRYRYRAIGVTRDWRTLEGEVKATVDRRMEKAGWTQAVNQYFDLDIVATASPRLPDLRSADRIAVIFGERGRPRRLVRTIGSSVTEVGPNQDWRPLLASMLDEAIAWAAAQPRTGGKDSGPALLEPISTGEHAAIERILSVLGEARDNRRLTTWQEDQIILMADLIRVARDEAMPAETERWRVVGVVGGALRYLAREMPEDIIKWGTAGVILTNIDWTHLAHALPG